MSDKEKLCNGCGQWKESGRKVAGLPDYEPLAPWFCYDCLPETSEEGPRGEGNTSEETGSGSADRRRDRRNELIGSFCADHFGTTDHSEPIRQRSLSELEAVDPMPPGLIHRLRSRVMNEVLGG